MTRRQRQIINAVSAATSVPVRDILGRHRYRAVVPARQAAQYLMAADGGVSNSHTAIGRVFRREHTTVWWGIAQSKRDIAVGGPRSVIIRRASEILASKNPVAQNHGQPGVVSQFEKSRSQEAEDLFAGLTPEEVIARFPWYGPQGTSRFMFDEAVGALVIRPEHRAEIDKAFARNLRTLKFRLYRQLAALYLEKLSLKIRYAALLLRHKLSRTGM